MTVGSPAIPRTAPFDSQHFAYGAGLFGLALPLMIYLVPTYGGAASRMSCSRCPNWARVIPL